MSYVHHCKTKNMCEITETIEGWGVKWCEINTYLGLKCISVFSLILHLMGQPKHRKANVPCLSCLPMQFPVPNLLMWACNMKNSIKYKRTIGWAEMGIAAYKFYEVRYRKMVRREVRHYIRRRRHVGHNTP